MVVDERIQRLFAENEKIRMQTRIDEWQDLLQVSKDEIRHLKTFIATQLFESPAPSPSPSSNSTSNISSQKTPPSLHIYGHPTPIEASASSSEVADLLMHSGALFIHPRNADLAEFTSTLMERRYDQIAGTRFVKNIVSEEVNGCLNFGGNFGGGLRVMARKLQLAQAVRRAVRTSQIELSACCSMAEFAEIPNECSLCSIPIHDRSLPSPFTNTPRSSASVSSSTLTSSTCLESMPLYTLTTPASPPQIICCFCRERLVSSCDFYAFLRMISIGLVTTDPEVVWAKTLALRERMFIAKNGLVQSAPSWS